MRLKNPFTVILLLSFLGCLLVGCKTTEVVVKPGIPMATPEVPADAPDYDFEPVLSGFFEDFFNSEGFKSLNKETPVIGIPHPWDYTEKWIDKSKVRNLMISIIQENHGSKCQVLALRVPASKFQSDLRNESGINLFMAVDEYLSYATYDAVMITTLKKITDSSAIRIECAMRLPGSGEAIWERSAEVKSVESHPPQ